MTGDVDQILEGAQDTISQLKAFPHPDISKDWPDYSELPANEKTFSDLIDIVKLDSERKLEKKEYHWLPVHAWRILSQHRATQAIPHLVDSLVHSDEEDDWSKEELPKAIAKFGALAIPELKKVLLEDTIFQEDVWGYVGATDALAEIGKNHPELKSDVATVLKEKLRDCELNQPLLNAFIISHLVDLEDRESLPLIQETFEKDFVDEQVIDWDWVRGKFPDMPGLPETLSRKSYSSTGFEYHGDSRFQKLLKTVGSHFNTDELRCFLLGSVLAIDLLPPSRLMSEVLVNMDGEENEFETQGQAAYFTRELLGLWHELSQFQDKVCELPSLECEHVHSEGECDETLEWAVYSFRQRHQLQSFLDGLEIGATRAKSFDDERAAAFITALETRLNQLDELEKSPKSDEKISRTKAMIAGIREYWNDNYLHFAAACKEERLKKMEKRKFIEAHGKIGRNDPCPCGSGMKFKKCCLGRYN